MKISKQQERDLVSNVAAGVYVTDYLCEKLRLLYVFQPVLPDNATQAQKDTYNAAVDQWNEDIKLEGFVQKYKDIIERTGSIEKRIFALALASIDWPGSSLEGLRNEALFEAMRLIPAANNVPIIDLIIEDMISKKITPVVKVL